jgi:peptidoglycan/xylan/chitin deacetylase (PgdA/CDA1 family)
MIITTSWDDGHPLDYKLVALLEKYDIKATFYIPLANVENNVMERSQMKDISNYHEIGGHTVNHIYLNN